MTKLKIGLAILLIAGVATILVMEHRSQVTLREENRSLLRQLSQLQGDHTTLSNRFARLQQTRERRTPGKPAQPAAVPLISAEDSHPTNLFARFQRLKAKAPNKLTAAQVEPYLKAHGRNAASLLAAYRTTGNTALLQEAMQNHPNDPRVALEAVLRKDAPVYERSRWLETFKQSDPDNAFPDYLSAFDLLQAGRTDQAVQELKTATGKQQFQDYSALGLQDNEQLYRAAGYSAAEAKAIAPLQEAILMETGSEDEAEAFAPLHSRLPQLQHVKDLCVKLTDLATGFQQSGDHASAQGALLIATDLGQRYSHAAGADGISQLTGATVELIALNTVDPATPYDATGQTVHDRINQLKQQSTAISKLYQEAVPLLGTLSEADWAGYNDRVRLFGEPAALQWVAGKYGRK
jgi:hypothetical protein